MGGALTAAGIVLKTPGNAYGDIFDKCEKGLAKDDSESYCEGKKLCVTLRHLRDQFCTFALGAGVPLFVAGPLPRASPLDCCCS